MLFQLLIIFRNSVCITITFKMKFFDEIYPTLCNLRLAHVCMLYRLYSINDRLIAIASQDIFHSLVAVSVYIYNLCFFSEN